MDMRVEMDFIGKQRARRCVARIVADRRSFDATTQVTRILAGGPEGVVFVVQGSGSGVWVARGCQVEAVAGSGPDDLFADLWAASWDGEGLVVLASTGDRFVARPHW